MDKKNLVAIIGVVAILIIIALVIRAKHQQKVERTEWIEKYGNSIK